MSTLGHIQEVFREVLELPDLQLQYSTTAAEVRGWTSMTHVRILLAIENRFRIRFEAHEIINVKNVGDLANLIESKARAA